MITKESEQKTIYFAGWKIITCENEPVLVNEDRLAVLHETQVLFSLRKVPNQPSEVELFLNQFEESQFKRTVKINYDKCTITI